MNKKNPLDSYKKFLLNRSSCSTPFVEFLEHCIAIEDEAANHCFHKVRVHNWSGDLKNLFSSFSDYFTSTFVPVDTFIDVTITSFYTSSLSFINKIIRYEFMSPYYIIDVVFNDKSSTDLFNEHITIDEIVSGVVTRRFTDRCELDLSDFCNDPEFAEKKIVFYKLALLSHFKILMLRMGRDTRALNLSNNKLEQPPAEILNFFIKGNLTSINFSNNKITTISDLSRVSSRIEKLWVEGNPLCDEMEPSAYVKAILMRFPRLTELDGVNIHETGLHFPFLRNYLETPDRLTKMLVDKFMTLYFSHYDTPHRPMLLGFYNEQSTLSITTGFSAIEEIEMATYASHSRNLLTHKRVATHINCMYTGKEQLKFLLCDRLPATQHDPSTFTVDVLQHDRLLLLIVITGIFKEQDTVYHPSRVYHFRRTFALRSQKPSTTWTYSIANDLLHITAATKDQINSSFKNPIRNHNSLELINPEREEMEVIIKIFMHITQIKREEAEVRLRQHQWNLRMSIEELINDMAKDNVQTNSFIEDDDISDISSLIDEID